MVSNFRSPIPSFQNVLGFSCPFLLRGFSHLYSVLFVCDTNVLFDVAFNVNSARTLFHFFSSRNTLSIHSVVLLGVRNHLLFSKASIGGRPDYRTSFRSSTSILQTYAHGFIYVWKQSRNALLTELILRDIIIHF